jgi:PhnB protein
VIGHPLNLAPQLAFAGECRSAFEFYAQLFGGSITVMNSFGSNQDRELPPGSTAAPPEHIRFAEVQFAGGVIRGNDLPANEFTPMRGFHLSVHVDNEGDARRILDALAVGGTITTSPTKVGWADLFATVVDRFGVPWLILGLKRD